MPTLTTLVDGSRGAWPQPQVLTMASPMPNVVLLGPSGCGKTRVAREVLSHAGLKASGYYSAESRILRGEAGTRGETDRTATLLEVTRVSGGTMTLAGTQPRPGWERVREQYVNPEAVDSLCRLLWEAACSARVELLILDEIGRPLGAFESFRRALLACWESGKRVLASLNVRDLLDGDERLLELLRRRPDLKVVEMEAPPAVMVERIVGLLAKRPGSPRRRARGPERFGEEDHRSRP